MVDSTPQPRPRIVLHVGRNKAGSTTIQHYCLQARDRLAARGIDYLLFGHLWNSVPGVPGFMTFGELVAHATARPDHVHLVSNEFMSAWPDEYTRDARASLAGCDVRILFYVRPYAPWLQSAYAEMTRKGKSRIDIDAFLDRQLPLVSALPNLRCWADCFGWENMHVRSLDPADLHRGNLLADFAHAIGADAPDAVAPQNSSPHWLELELIRALTEKESEEEWGGAAREEVMPLAEIMREAAAAVPQTPYLTLGQRDALTRLFNEDVAAIRRESGIVLSPAPAASGPERSFVPSLDHIPAAAADRFFAMAAAPQFAERFPAAARRADMLRRQPPQGAFR